MSIFTPLRDCVLDGERLVLRVLFSGARPLSLICEVTVLLRREGVSGSSEEHPVLSD